MTLTLNIIFCAGTVRTLRLGAFSLLKHTPYRLHIVGNALDDAESKMLAAFCATSDRITYLDFPTKRILPHDTMMSLLFQRGAEEWFAIVDSDIFALEPLTARIDADLAAYDVFSYGDPVNTEFSDEVRRRVGDSMPISPHQRRHRFRTYFALFRSSTVRSVWERTGAGFSAFARRSQVPAIAWDYLDAEKTFAKGFTDSAELFAALASALGHRVSHGSNRGLLHLGNMTRPNEKKPKNLEVISDSDLFGNDRSASSRTSDSRGKAESGQPGSFKDWKKNVRRGFRSYFSALLTNAMAGRPGPRIEVSLPSARKRLLEIEAQLTALATEFRRTVPQ